MGRTDGAGQGHRPSGVDGSAQCCWKTTAQRDRDLDRALDEALGHLESAVAL